MLSSEQQVNETDGPEKFQQKQQRWLTTDTATDIFIRAHFNSHIASCLSSQFGCLLFRLTQEVRYLRGTRLGPGLDDRQIGVRIPATARGSPLLRNYRTDSQPNQPPFNAYCRLFPRVRQPTRVACHLPLSRLRIHGAIITLPPPTHTHTHIRFRGVELK
jgi:hypothetical protein